MSRFILASDRALVARSADRLAELVAPFADRPFVELHDLMDPNELVDSAVATSCLKSPRYVELLEDWDEAIAVYNAVAEEHDLRIKIEARVAEVAAFAVALGMPLLDYQRAVVRQLLRAELSGSHPQATEGS